MRLELLKNSIPTVLIPTRERVRRSRKRRGSVACTEQGERGGTTRSKPFVRVSRIWLGCISEEETQRGVILSRCHTVDNVASRSMRGVCVVCPRIQFDRRDSSEEANGVKSQPKYDEASASENMGSPKLAGPVNAHQYGDGVPIVPNRLPVMGLAAGHRSGRSAANKSAAMLTNLPRSWGKWSSSFALLVAQKEDC